jgi:aryl-alcohol dehydrogenase-like predicted oxidoreductase
MTIDTNLSRLGLGCSKIGSFGNPTPMSALRELLATALELGVTVFDTADIYGQGDSEREIGRLLKGRRDRGFVVTKCGQTFSAKMRLAAPFKPVLKPLLMAMGKGQAVTSARESARGVDFSPARYPAALEASLKRLGFDEVDALLLHGPTAEDLADPAHGEVLASLKQAGKVRRFGVSCDDVGSLRAALAMPGLTMLELPVDVIDQAEAGDLGAVIRERGVIVLAREIMRLRPELTPVEAVKRSVADPLTRCTVVGTSKIAHLRELVEAAAGG